MPLKRLTLRKRDFLTPNHELTATGYVALVPPIPFAFAHDRALRAVIATLRGNWTMDTVAEYKMAVLADMKKTQPGQEPLNALFDIRECGLHVRGVADAMMAFRRTHIPEMVRIAIVTQSALDAIQVRRITAAHQHAVFPTIEAARSWLANAPPPTSM